MLKDDNLIIIIIRLLKLSITYNKLYVVSHHSSILKLLLIYKSLIIFSYHLVLYYIVFKIKYT